VLGDPATAGEVWFALHGYGQLASRFARRLKALGGVGSGSRAVVVPEALSRFYVESRPGPHGPESRVGAAWMTREAREDEIRDYVDYLDTVAEAVLGESGSSVRVVVLGFSQGAETASRWVVRGAIAPAELVLWAGGLAADLDVAAAEAALRDVAVRFVVGDADEWARARVTESVARLRSRGLAAERIDYAGGHWIDAAVLERRWPV
jgi:predicted esterase